MFGMVLLSDFVGINGFQTYRRPLLRIRARFDIRETCHAESRTRLVGFGYTRHVG